ncbi:MAG: 3-hydroxyacyl-CoA dehydrogenase PaaC [Rhodocyclales bacterium]|nr:3-hydroxyacyl-CoA dehydrogenase PaaC [Rhodocyclales bacterium]
MTALSNTTRVLVIGAGAMGSGIAHVAARAGHGVYLYDTRAEAAVQGRAAIARDLDALVARGKLPQAEADAVLARVSTVAQLADARDAGLAIEAIVENLAVKQALFRELEALLGSDAIIASNTSSLSITAMAAALQRPQRLVGMHFFNPAPRMKLVEIVSGLTTAPEHAACLHATAVAWGKIAVHTRSTPGFIVNRVARPFYGEALRVLAERAADSATLDAVLREGCGFPMGPFELMDFIGHDVNFAVSNSVFDACFGDRRYTPSLIQQELVAAGWLGRKSGRGFYDYADGAARPRPHEAEGHTAQASVTVAGDLGPAAPMLARLAAAGIAIRRTPVQGRMGWMEIGGTRVALSDGRTATRHAVEDGCPDLVLFDLCLDYTSATRITLTRADQCDAVACGVVAATLQQAGYRVSVIDDVAGMLALRTVAMLINEGADVLLQGIASAADIDAAMSHGTNYPHGGPLAWADRLGADLIVTILHNLQRHYGEERYRVSPLLQRKAINGEPLHE